MVIKEPQTKKIKDKYPRRNIASYWILVLAAVLLLIGMLSWLIFGSYNLTVTGYADVIKGTSNYLYVQAEDVDKIATGMTAKIGDSKGTVTWIGKEYLTYDELKSIYGPSIKYLHLSTDKSYYEVFTDIQDEESGYLPYTIIYKTISPLDYFLGVY